MNNRFRLISSTNMTAAILLVLASIVLITLLSEKHYLRWDLTAAGEHTLSEKTLQVLKTVKEPVAVKAFVQEGQGTSDEVKRLLGAYCYHAPNIQFELIDPDRSPALANRYNIRSLNTLVLEGYQSSQTIKLPDEENITNALVRLSKKETNTAYWLSGHGERSFEGTEPESFSRLKEHFSKENFQFKDLNLMKGDVPQDAALLVVAGPEKPLFPEEVESIGRYLNKGGSLLLFLDPFKDGGLAGFLKERGVLIAQDIIVDKMSRVMGGDYLLPMAVSYGNHEITRDFRITSFFPLARSVEVDTEKREKLTLTGLAYTSPDSWAETDRQALEQGKVALEERDRRGPVCLAVAGEFKPSAPKEGEEKEKKEGSSEGTGKGRLVVFGDSDFASNKYFNLSGNGDLITNTVNFLAGRKDLITIPKKQKPAHALTLTQGQGLALFFVPVVLIPLSVLVLGVVVWSRRRSR